MARRGRWHGGDDGTEGRSGEQFLGCHPAPRPPAPSRPRCPHLWVLPPRRVLLGVLTTPGSPGVRGRGLGAAGASRWILVTLRSELGFIFAFSHSVSQTFQPRLPKYLSSDSVFPTATFFLFFPLLFPFLLFFFPFSPCLRPAPSRGLMGHGELQGTDVGTEGSILPITIRTRRRVGGLNPPHHGGVEPRGFINSGGQTGVHTKTSSSFQQTEHREQGGRATGVQDGTPTPGAPGAGAREGAMLSIWRERQFCAWFPE